MADDLATPDVTAMVAWLREQIDEDERVVREAKAESVEWLAQYGVDCALDGAAEAIRHFADPARVLREVEAKRRILIVAITTATPNPDVPEAGARYEAIAQEYDTKNAEHIMKAVALPYADRPGFREEWRP